MAKILETDPPPMSSLQPMTPPALDRVVKKCLAKEPDERWQSASDLCDELKWIAEGGSQVAVGRRLPAAKGIRALGRRPLIVSVGALLLVAVVASLATWNLKPSPAPPPKSLARFTITLPPGQQLAVWIVALLWPSLPTALILPMSRDQGGTQQLYLRAMDSLEAKPIPGTDGAINPFFSPDGQWVGFFAGGKLKKVSVSGGAALTLGEAAAPRGASWGSQGMIAFAPITRRSSPASVGRGRHPAAADASRQGGDQPPLAGVLARRQGSALCCRSDATDWTNAQVAVQSLGTGERRNLVQGGRNPATRPPGIWFMRKGGT